MDLIGFGLSQKAALDYSNGKPWVQQISDFIQQVRLVERYLARYLAGHQDMAHVCTASL